MIPHPTWANGSVASKEQSQGGRTELTVKSSPYPRREAEKISKKTGTMRDLHRGRRWVSKSIMQRFSNPVLHLAGNQISVYREMHTLMCVMYVNI